MDTEYSSGGLGGAEPGRPVTRAEVVRYVVGVVLAERKRLARILAEREDPELQAEAVGSDKLDPDDFRWD